MTPTEHIRVKERQSTGKRFLGYRVGECIPPLPADYAQQVQHD